MKFTVGAIHVVLVGLLLKVCIVHSWLAVSGKGTGTSVYVYSHLMSTTSNINSNNNSNKNNDSVAFLPISSILDDGNGHISRDLASSIWNWDHENRLQSAAATTSASSSTTAPTSASTSKSYDDMRNDNAKFKYSTRKGLKIVDQVARELMDTLETKSFSSTASSQYGTTEDSSAMSYSDLVQEGVVALMYAMANFDSTTDGTPSGTNSGIKTETETETETTANTEQSFETYATQQIKNNMARCLADDSRPIRIPNHVHAILQKARTQKVNMENELQREVTTAELAAHMDIALEKLELYQLVSRGTLSMESTVEVYDPWLDNDSAPFRDEKDWENEHTMNNVNEGNQQRTEEGEGEDEMWVKEKQIAGPLADFIQDMSAEASPDDMALANMIQHDVNDFLTKILEPKRELQVIRMRYGLHNGTGTPLGLTQVSKILNISKTRVAQIEEEALDKLRMSYMNRYVETYLEDEWITDTV